MTFRVTTMGMFRQGVEAMQAQSQALSKTQTQLATNQKFQRAGEDPVAAGRALNVDKAMADTARWQANIGTASDRLALEDSVLANATSALDRIRELAIEANSDTLTDTDRAAIAKEMQERLKDLIEQANAKDGQGAYLFSGSRSSSQPFASSNGSVTYRGDSLVSQLAIGSNRDITLGDDGNDVFMSLSAGNGRLDVSVPSTNLGLTKVESLGFSDSSHWDGGAYTVSFLGGQYSVLDAGGNTVGSGAYSDGGSIEFRGVSLTLSGQPSDGDSFSVGASQRQDMFTSVQKLIDVVSAYGRTPAQDAQDQTTFFSALNSIDTAITHLGTVRAGVGARLNALDDADTQLSARSAQLQQSLTSLREIDYVETAATLSQQQTALQAAQQSYLKVQSLSLFDYLS